MNIKSWLHSLTPARAALLAATCLTAGAADAEGPPVPDFVVATSSNPAHDVLDKEAGQDLIRLHRRASGIALRLKREPRVASFIVESESFESIHNHSAYAHTKGRNG